MIEISKNHSDAAAVAAAAAKDLAKELARLSASQDGVDLVLTGGSVGIATLAELAKLIEPKDLAKVRFFWGDERFVAKDSPDRNERQAREALLDKLAVDEAQLEPFPSTADGDLEDSAIAFAERFEKLSPKFDIVLLGMGSDGHVASLFPANTGKMISAQVVIETNSPKPPAERLSLSFEALNNSSQVWFVVSGADKAKVVSEVISGDSQLPAARVSGRETTRWYLDSAAASALR